MDPEDPGQGSDHAAPLAPEEMVAELHLAVESLDRPYLHRATDIQDRTGFRELHRFVKITGLNDDEASDHVLRLGVRAVSYSFLAAGDNLAGLLQRMTGVLQAPSRLKFLEPGCPLRHVLLGLFG